MSPKFPGIATLRHAGAVVADHARDYLVTALIVQGAIVVVGMPALLRLFGMLDSRVEVTSPTALGIGEALADPFADLLLLAMVVAIAILAYLELATMLLVALRHRRNQAVSVRGVASDLAGAVRRLGHPSTLLLIPYLLIVLPGGPLGLGLILGLGVRVPDFVTGELSHSVPAAIVTVVVVLALLYLGLRLAYTLPNLLANEHTVLQAMGASWRMTRSRALRLLAIGLIIVVVAAALIAGTYTLGMLPTRWADANWPDAAAAIAGVSLTLIEVVVFAIVAAAVAVGANALVHGLSLSKTPAGTASVRSRRARFAGVVAAVAACAVVLAGLTATNLATVQSLVQSNDTLVIAHRGLLTGGVENTIPALEAAAAIHPDLVEIDIQETADDQFVVMHDPTLGRLSDRTDRIRDLTLAELQRIELHQDGHTALVDSLDDYIDRAVALDQKLLVELKIQGDESPDYLDLLIATLERHGVLDQYWVHSLDKATIEELERREPQIPTGYIMMFNLGHAPETTADFVVMQELSYTQDLLDEVHAAGKSLLLWSVDDVPTMQNSLRDNVDGLISYKPDVVEQQRAEVEADTSVADRVDSYARRLLGW
jgi:glycerophosphoryl diester phosphodiesterase